MQYNSVPGHEHRLRRLWQAVLILVTYLTVFLALEMFQFSRRTQLEFFSFSSVFAQLAVVLVLSVPLFRAYPALYVVLGWSLLFLGFKLFLFRTRLFASGRALYFGTAETLLLAGSVWLAHRVAHTFQDVLRAIRSSAEFEQRPPMRPFSFEDEEVRSVIAHSRKYERPLSLLVVTPAAGTLRQMGQDERGDPGEQHAMRRYILTSLGEAIGDVLRRSDILLEHKEEQRLVIVCPETSVIGANIVSDRLRTTTADQLGMRIACGSASFPDDGLSFDELLQRALARLAASPDFGSYQASEVEHPV